MKNLFLRTLVIGLFLLVIPVKQYGQNPQFTHSQPTLDFDITEISLFDERIFFMYTLLSNTTMGTMPTMMSESILSSMKR